MPNIFPYIYGMNESLPWIVVLSLHNVATWILAHKWGIVAKYQLARLKWMPRNCNFCYFFWLAFIEWLFFEIDGFEGFKIIDSIITPFFFALATASLSLFFKPKPE